MWNSLGAISSGAISAGAQCGIPPRTKPQQINTNFYLVNICIWKILSKKFIRFSFQFQLWLSICMNIRRRIEHNGTSQLLVKKVEWGRYCDWNSKTTLVNDGDLTAVAALPFDPLRNYISLMFSVYLLFKKRSRHVTKRLCFLSFIGTARIVLSVIIHSPARKLAQIRIWR